MVHDEPLHVGQYLVEGSRRIHDVTVGEATGTFYIIEEAQPQPQSGILPSGPLDSGAIIAIVIIGIIIVGGTVFAFLFFTRRA